MDLLGVWSRETILAEYEVNKNNADMKSSNIVSRAELVDGETADPIIQKNNMGETWPKG